MGRLCCIAQRRPTILQFAKCLSMKWVHLCGLAMTSAMSHIRLDSAVPTHQGEDAQSTKSCPWSLRKHSLTPTLPQANSGLNRAMRPAIPIRIRIVRGKLPVKRRKPKPCEAKARFFFLPFLPVSQESVLKVSKQRQLHAAIRVTPKCCDSSVHGALGKQTVWRQNLRDAESLAKHCDQIGQ